MQQMKREIGLKRARETDEIDVSRLIPNQWTPNGPHWKFLSLPPSPKHNLMLSLKSHGYETNRPGAEGVRICFILPGVLSLLLYITFSPKHEWSESRLDITRETLMDHRRARAIIYKQWSPQWSGTRHYFIMYTRVMDVRSLLCNAWSPPQWTG